MTGSAVHARAESVLIARPSALGTAKPVTAFLLVRFDYDSYHIDGIEQNPETGSRWALLAREGKHIMQFSLERRYIGNVSEGKLTRYPAWHAVGLPQ